MTAFIYPPQIHCAVLPTRIERLVRYGETLPGVEVWVKRDDQSGFLLSGNKVRKLEFVFARALAEGVTGVVTCGGVDSNHCRATTYLAARLGLESHLFLRTTDGQPPDRLQGNTLLNRIAGAQIRWITPAAYRHRDALMEAHAREQALAGKRLHVIPEGASNAIGALGFVKAVEELQEQLESKNLRVDHVVHAMGSGGTTAGLLAGRAIHGAGWRVVGVPVCDDEKYFRARVREIRQEMTGLGVPPPEDPEALDVLDGHQGRGYGLTTPTELRWIRDFCRLEGLLLDPCYTGKALYGLHQEIVAGRYPSGTRILFLHTGGSFANFSYESEWAEVLG